MVQGAGELSRERGGVGLLKPGGGNPYAGRRGNPEPLPRGHRPARRG
jgi:hypothetical protein